MKSYEIPNFSKSPLVFCVTKSSNQLSGTKSAATLMRFLWFVLTLSILQ